MSQYHPAQEAFTISREDELDYTFQKSLSRWDRVGHRLSEAVHAVKAISPAQNLLLKREANKVSRNPQQMANLEIVASAFENNEDQADQTHKRPTEGRTAGRISEDWQKGDANNFLQDLDCSSDGSNSSIYSGYTIIRITSHSGASRGKGDSNHIDTGSNARRKTQTASSTSNTYPSEATTGLGLQCLIVDTPSYSQKLKTSSNDLLWEVQDSRPAQHRHDASSLQERLSVDPYDLLSRKKVKATIPSALNVHHWKEDYCAGPSSLGSDVSPSSYGDHVVTSEIMRAEDAESVQNSKLRLCQGDDNIFMRELSPLPSQPSSEDNMWSDEKIDTHIPMEDNKCLTSTGNPALPPPKPNHGRSNKRHEMTRNSLSPPFSQGHLPRMRLLSPKAGSTFSSTQSKAETKREFQVTKAFEQGNMTAALQQAADGARKEERAIAETIANMKELALTTVQTSRDEDSLERVRFAGARFDRADTTAHILASRQNLQRNEMLDRSNSCLAVTRKNTNNGGSVLINEAPKMRSESSSTPQMLRGSQRSDRSKGTDPSTLQYEGSWSSCLTSPLPAPPLLEGEFYGEGRHGPPQRHELKKLADHHRLREQQQQLRSGGERIRTLQGAWPPPRSDNDLFEQYDNHLREEDIELVEEVPILTEQSCLTGIRRRLVSEFETLGARAGRPLSTKSSICSTNGNLIGERDSQKPWKMVLLSEKEMKKREEALEAREKDLTIEALSKTEMAQVTIEIWTESRRGKWTVRGPVTDDGYPPDVLPEITDPWAIPIDSKGTVARKKLKSNVEMSSTRTVVSCPDCSQARKVGIRSHCRTCDDYGRVEMVYSVQCIMRLAQFSPLKLPAVLLLGSRQPHFQYIDIDDLAQRVDILRERATDGLQSAAGRVEKAHHAQHGSRLLMGRATISRRGVLTVCVTSSRNKSKRIFDIEDGPDGQMTEIVHQHPLAAGQWDAPAGFDCSDTSSLSPEAIGVPAYLTSPGSFASMRRTKQSNSNTPDSSIHHSPTVNSPTMTISPSSSDKKGNVIKTKKSLKALFHR